MFNVGDCFLITSGTYDDGSPKLHPFVVITEFDEETGDAILVTFSSTDGKPRYDRTTIFPARSHDFITEESYAAYYLSGRMSQLNLQMKIDNGDAIEGNPMPERMLIKLRAGIMASIETPPEIKDFYQDCLFRRLK